MASPPRPRLGVTRLWTLLPLALASLPKSNLSTVSAAWLAPRRPFGGPPGSFHRRNRDTELAALWNQTSTEALEGEEGDDEDRVNANNANVLEGSSCGSNKDLYQSQVGSFPAPGNVYGDFYNAVREDADEESTATTENEEASSMGAEELVIDESLSQSLSERFTTTGRRYHHTNAEMNVYTTDGSTTGSEREMAYHKE